MTRTFLISLSLSFLVSLCVYAADAPPPLVLTLDDVVACALTNNQYLQAFELEYEISGLSVDAEKSYWEPDLSLSADYESNHRKNTIEQELNMFTETFEEKNYSYSATVEGDMSYGGRYSFGYTLSDLGNNLTNLTFREYEAFDSQYVSFAGARFVQPLLKNAGRRMALSRIEDSNLKREIAYQEYRRQKMLTVARAEIAFWNLWGAERHVELRKQSLEIARALVDDNKSRLEQGKMSEIEVEQARLGAAYRERQLLMADSDLQAATRELMNIMGKQTGEGSVSLKVTEKNKSIADFDVVASGALDRHPDMLIAKKEIELQDLQLVMAKNQRWPQLDLVASYGYNGLGDTIGDSVDDVAAGDFISWSAGVALSIPLGGGISARALTKQANLKKAKALSNYKAVETDVVNGLRFALDRIETLQKGMKLLDDEVDTQRMVLENEKILLENGKSTSRRLLELEEDLSASTVERLHTDVERRNVLVQLSLSDGGLLERRGMEVAPLMSRSEERQAARKKAAEEKAHRRQMEREEAAGKREAEEMTRENKVREEKADKE